MTNETKAPPITRERLASLIKHDFANHEWSEIKDALRYLERLLGEAEASEIEQPCDERAAPAGPREKAPPIDGGVVEDAARWRYCLHEAPELLLSIAWREREACQHYDVTNAVDAARRALAERMKA